LAGGPDNDLTPPAEVRAGNIQPQLPDNFVAYRVGSPERQSVSADQGPHGVVVHSFERCRTTRDAVKRRRTEGFVLALTLWVIALFGLGVAAINTWVTTATENARALRQRVDDELMLSN